MHFYVALAAVAAAADAAAAAACGLSIAATKAPPSPFPSLFAPPPPPPLLSFVTPTLTPIKALVRFSICFSDCANAGNSSSCDADCDADVAFAVYAISAVCQQRLKVSPLWGRQSIVAAATHCTRHTVPKVPLGWCRTCILTILLQLKQSCKYCKLNSWGFCKIN